ncbi:MAG TPA: PilZ domain-containing protein [Acidothermaceae bacterium]
MMPNGMETLALNAPVLVRLADGQDHEYAARIADFDVDEILISAPAGGSAALLASGAREVDVAWLSRRGRYEQRCVIVDHAAVVQVGQKQSSLQKLWRLRPVRRPVLIQRRRHIRVTAKLPVRVVIGSNASAGVTIDISEGGFRVRLPRQHLPDLAHATVHATVGAARVAVSGYVMRSIDAPPNHTDAVIAFDAAGTDADAIRRLVLNAKLRSKTTRTASARSPRSR